MMFLIAQPSKEDGGMSIILGQRKGGEGRGGFFLERAIIQQVEPQ